MSVWSQAPAAVVGIGESQYYRRGQSPVSEFELCLQAIQRAVADAGVSITDIDGFASYHDERSDPVRLATALGLPELRFTSLVWGGGGGGVCGAVAHAAAAVAMGQANYVLVHRALVQGAHRFGRAGVVDRVSGPGAFTAPYGVATPAQLFAFRVMRFMHDYRVGQEAQRAVALASYHHAQSNPRAVMRGRPLTAEAYDVSRWIVEPFHLYDCCMENDGAAAVIVTTPDRAVDRPQAPAYVRAAIQSSGYRFGSGFGAPEFASANFRAAAERLYQQAGISPADIDVMQSYENFTGGVVMSIVEHGLCQPEEINEFVSFENLIAPHGRLPLNTSGGNLAECYVHGMELVLEAVRQVRGTSTAQVADVEFALVAGGPMVAPVSNLVLSPVDR